MKKLFATLFLAASLGVSACAASSMSSGTMKANLEGKGYAVYVLDKETAKKQYSSLNFVVDINDALNSSKGKEVLLAFFCANADDASKFITENISILYHSVENYGAPKVGAHNNVAYAGTYQIAADAGLPVSQE